jgi:hypothetical protein
VRNDDPDTPDNWPEAAWIEQGDGLAALTPRLIREEQRFIVDWGEAGHRRAVVCRRLNDSEAPERIEFVGVDGRKWVFRDLTLERWNEKVRPHTIGKPVFASREEMLEQMRREW